MILHSCFGKINRDIFFSGRWRFTPDLINGGMGKDHPDPGLFFYSIAQMDESDQEQPKEAREGDGDGVSSWGKD